MFMFILHYYYSQWWRRPKPISSDMQRDEYAESSIGYLTKTIHGSSTAQQPDSSGWVDQFSKCRIHQIWNAKSKIQINVDKFSAIQSEFGLYENIVWSVVLHRFYISHFTWDGPFALCSMFNVQMWMCVCGCAPDHFRCIY